jgi:hypothetical protein
MKATKINADFDCLAFKQTSQEKMAEEMKNLSYSDHIEYLQKRLTKVI